MTLDRDLKSSRAARHRRTGTGYTLRSTAKGSSAKRERLPAAGKPTAVNLYYSRPATS